MSGGTGDAWQVEPAAEALHIETHSAMTLTFGLNAPSRLAALRDAVERFEADYLNKDLAGDCAIKAWHLAEHVFQERKSSLPFEKDEDFRSYVIEACPDLAHLRVICDAAKHGDVIKQTGEVADTREHRGGFDRNHFHPADFDTDCLQIVLTDGKEVSFDDALDSALRFWSQFFEDHGIE